MKSTSITSRLDHEADERRVCVQQLPGCKFIHGRSSGVRAVTCRNISRNIDFHMLIQVVICTEIRAKHLCGYVSVQTCSYIYIYTPINRDAHTYIYILTYIHIHIVDFFLPTYIHTYLYIYICRHTSAGMYMRIHTCG